jgi:hypothetical protein
MVTFLPVCFLCCAGQGRISAPLGLSVPSTAQAIDNIGGLTDAYKGVSTRMRMSLKIGFFCLLSGRAGYILNMFLLCSLVVTAIKIYVTLNRLKIVLEFISAPPLRLLFVYDICLVPARKYYFLHLHWVPIMF